MADIENNMDLIHKTLMRLEIEVQEGSSPKAATRKRAPTCVDKSTATSTSTRGTSPKKALSKKDSIISTAEPAGTLKPTPLHDSTVPVVDNAVSIVEISFVFVLSASQPQNFDARELSLIT
ncbi:hypothetical protein HDU76_000241 [Blyttiomyces sp. JEL0837]|nr:hypothetical protein HDU76_000241 [Blyttiomyces sp. JEL0837]